MLAYEQFLESKALFAQPCGIEREVLISSELSPFQKACVLWALKRGRAALLEDCGLGKTRQQIEWARHVLDATDKPVLILAPLAVATQSIIEAEILGLTPPPPNE